MKTILLWVVPFIILALNGCTNETTDVLTTDECLAKGGEVFMDPGDGSLHRNGCGEGQEFLGSIALGEEGGICCK